MVIELEDIKQHLMIEHNLDDYLLLTYEEAAVEAVKTHCNVDSIDDLCDENGDLDTAVRQAILLLIGTFYSNRESVTYGSPVNIPYTFEYLISLKQKYYKSNQTN